MKALATAALVGLAFAGLGRPALAADPDPCTAHGGVLRAAMSSNTPTMDAILSTTTVTRQLAIHLWESLVTVDSQYHMIPQLALNWERSDDGLTYTFHLRPDVKFHNGATMTAADVAASLQRYFKVSPPSVHNMVVTLEKRGFITRTAGAGRSIRLRQGRDQLPDLD